MTRAGVRPVVAKTASYTINPAVDKPGTLFTNRGASGAVTFSLPTANQALAGWEFFFKAHAAQNLLVNAVSGGIVTLNNAAATSLAAQTGSQIIGAEIHALCDGTSWFVSGVAVGHTYTVA